MNEVVDVMKRLAAPVLCGMILFACAGPGLETGEPVKEVGSDAVWQVTMRRLHAAVEEQCRETGRGGIDPCYHTVMESLGAGPAAVRFSESLDMAGHLRDFQEVGPVDVGWVVYPFRANERYGCMLLNGTPARVDVDDPAFRPTDLLEGHARFQALRKDYPEVSIWPGDRGGPGHLALEELPEGGYRFVAGYELRDGCHACEMVGRVDFAFDFDESGVFLGSRPASMASVIHVAAGKTVTLSVEAGSTGCERWRMVRLPPSRSLPLESKGVYSGLRGEKRDREAWTFLALEPGRFPVDLRCVTSDGKASFPTARKSFLVVVHEDETAWASALEEGFAPVINRRLHEMQSPRAGKVDMRVKGIHGDVARVDISSRNPASEAWAMVYLKSREGTWEVVGMGTHFERSFYRTHGVPPELQGPMDSVDSYVPISGAACKGLMEAVSEVLGLKGRLEERVLFFGLNGREIGEACRITLQATGDLVPGTAEAAESIRRVLEDRGWSEDPAYRADGPLGTTAGFRKEAKVILLRVIVEPGEEAGLLSNRPLSVEELLPEERLYTIVIEGAQPPSGP